MTLRPLWYHPTPAEVQTRKRIKVAVAAYAYEVVSRPIMTDSEFDAMATEIDLSIPTARPDMDEWFKREYQPHTGQWIWKHPQLVRIGEIYERQYR